MKIKGQLEWTDYLHAQLLHFMPTGLARIGCYGVVVFGILALAAGIFFSLIGSSDFNFITYVPGLLFALFLVLYRFVILPRQVKHIFSQQKELSAPFEMEINETGLTVVNEFGNNRRPWANFVKWKEDQHLFMLYHSDVAFTMVPKRLLTDETQIQAIRNYLQQNKVAAGNSRSNSTVRSIIVYVLVLVAIGVVLWTVRNSTPTR